MENNNNNFQNEAKNVNENVNQNVQKKQKNEKVKTVILIVIVMILVLVAGIFGGLLLSGNGDKVTNIISGNNENKVENKTIKKVDESKPWVYDADYNQGKKAKTITNNDGKVYYSTDELIVPYVNVNSKYGETVNAELKALFEKEYDGFGGAYSDLQISSGYISRIQYQYVVSDEILSVTVEKFGGVINGGSSRQYYIYNINLTTLEEASLADVYKSAGFSSESEFKESVNNTVANEIAEGNLFEEDIKLDYKLYFLDKDKLFNLVLTSPSGNPCGCIIKPGTTRKTTNSTSLHDDSEEQKYHKQSDFSFMADEGFKNVIYESEKVNNGFYYKVVFDANGNPSISIENLSNENGNYMYGTYRDFYDINYDVGAGQAYVSFKFKDSNDTGSEQNGVIHYSHVTDNESITLKLSVPYGEQQNKEITLKKSVENK